MKVTGFSFIRNAIKFDYPIVEAIRSILPLCDDFVVAVGASEDGTRTLIESIDPGKIRILDTVWDDSLREGGRVLAQETNKAFQAIGEESDWCFYIQGDEVVHENDYPRIREAMEKWKEDPRVEGLLFRYLHFYGSYDYIGTSSTWYPREIRIIRNDKSIYSHGDAQGFRKGRNQKLRVKPVDAHIYHYGWVKSPESMQKKQQSFNRLWHDDQWMEKHIPKQEAFDFAAHIDRLERFEGSHPQCIAPRIAAQNWRFDYDVRFNRTPWKDRFKSLIYRWLGIDLNYKNYRL